MRDELEADIVIKSTDTYVGKEEQEMEVQGFGSEWLGGAVKNTGGQVGLCL